MTNNLPPPSIPIVIDCGTFETRIGFANSEPIVVRSITQRLGGNNYAVGHTPLRAGRSMASFPVDSGVVTSPMELSRIFDHFLSENGVDAEHVQRHGLPWPIVFTEPLGMPSLGRAILSEMAIQGYRAPGVAFVVADLAAATHAAGGALPEHALVVGLGHAASTVIPVVDGAGAWQAARRIPVGGEALDDFVRELLFARWPAIRSLTTPQTLMNFKHKHILCCESLDFNWMKEMDVDSPIFDLRLDASRPAVASSLTSAERSAIAKAREANKRAVSVHQSSASTSEGDLINDFGENEVLINDEDELEAEPEAEPEVEPEVEQDAAEAHHNHLLQLQRTAALERARESRRLAREAAAAAEEAAAAAAAANPAAAAFAACARLEVVVSKMTAALRAESVSRRSASARDRLTSLDAEYVADADVLETTMTAAATGSADAVRAQLTALETEARAIRGEIDSWVNRAWQAGGKEAEAVAELRFGGIIQISANLGREYESVRELLGEEPLIDVNGLAIIPIAGEAFTVPELIFKPYLGGETPIVKIPGAAAIASATQANTVGRTVKLPGLGEIMARAASLLPEFGRCTVNTFVVGGTANIPGIGNRIRNELQCLTESGLTANTTVNGDTLAAWRGAAAWALQALAQKPRAGAARRYPTPACPTETEATMGEEYLDLIAANGFLTRSDWSYMPEGALQPHSMAASSWVRLRGPAAAATAAVQPLSGRAIALTRTSRGQLASLTAQNPVLEALVNGNDYQEPDPIPLLGDPSDAAIARHQTMLRAADTKVAEQQPATPAPRAKKRRGPAEDADWNPV